MWGWGERWCIIYLIQASRFFFLFFLSTNLLIHFSIYISLERFTFNVILRDRNENSALRSLFCATPAICMILKLNIFWILRCYYFFLFLFLLLFICIYIFSLVKLCKFLTNPFNDCFLRTFTVYWLLSSSKL